MFLQVSCLISNSSLQRGWADVIFLSLHIKAAMPLFIGGIHCSDTELGCGALGWCEPGRESAWCFYWHLFACRWLINIKQLFSGWIQVGVEHMFCPRAGPRIWIPHGKEDPRGCIRSQWSGNLEEWINTGLDSNPGTKELAHDEIGL